MTDQEKAAAGIKIPASAFDAVRRQKDPKGVLKLSQPAFAAKMAHRIVEPLANMFILAAGFALRRTIFPRKSMLVLNGGTPQ